jgi:hypothetical protein
VRRVHWGLVLIAALGFGLAASSRARPTPTTSTARVALRSGSRLLANGELEPGQLSDAAVLRRVRDVLDGVPTRLAPERVVLDWEPSVAPGVPRVRGIEFHTQSGSLLLSSSAPDLSREAWLHELGHVRMQGARPRTPLARRLLQAIEEGFADYYAAAVAGTPRVAAEGEARDLSQPPRTDETDWMRLTLESFEPHRLGWALASELYRREARAGALLEDAVACLDGPSPLDRLPESAAAAVRGLLAECPERSRDSLSQALGAWLPAEISASESLP